MDKTITIGARYLREGIKRDYSDWRFSWAREMGQNSIDAGSIHVIITVELNGDGNTVVSWKDDGCGMSADIIENKFMALGESGKEDSGVGGFGVACALIAFAHLEYSIHSLDTLAEGAGSKYKLTKAQYVKGCHTTVVMEGDEVRGIKEGIKKWVRLTTTKTSFYLDGEMLDTLRTHKPKHETTWCRVSTYNNVYDNAYSYGIHVRMNGQLMFTKWCNFGITIIVDLTGESLNYLTSNRDGLRDNWGYKLSSLILELYQNPNKIRGADSKTTIWRGTKGIVRLSGDSPRKVSKISMSQPTLAKPSGEVVKALSMLEGQILPVYEAYSITEIKTLIDGHDVVIVNETSKTVPEKWIPGQMNKHGYKLLNRFIRLVQFCGGILDRKEDVSIGWVFSCNSIAEYEYSQEYGHMILLNPIKVGDTRFTNAWNNTNASFYDLVATVVHEITHIDHDNHNVSFANAITDNMGKVFSRSTALKKIKAGTKV